MARTYFQKGNQAARASRGKPRNGGRALAVRALDAVLARASSRRLLEDALAAELARDPVKFFREVVVPLVPRRTLEKLEEQDRRAWLAGVRAAFLLEAKVTVSGALREAGAERLSERVCRALDRAAGGQDLRVTLDVGDEGAG